MAGVIRTVCEARSVYSGPKLEQGHAGRSHGTFMLLKRDEIYNH